MMQFLKTLRKRLSKGVLRFWEKYMRAIVLTSLIALFLLAYFWDSIFISIFPGEKGVMWRRFHQGVVLNKVYEEGLHTIFPWDILYIYDTRVHERHVQLQFLDTTGLVIKVDISVRFHPQFKNLPKLHQEVGPDYVEKVVFPEVTSAFRVVLGGLSYQAIYSASESELLSLIRKKLSEKLEAKYIVLDMILLENLELPQMVQAAIQEKQVYQQVLLSYEYRLKSEALEVERKTLEGQGIAAFQDVSGIPILQWAGIEATAKFADSPNSKIIIIGTDSDSLPVILNTAQ